MIFVEAEPVGTTAHYTDGECQDTSGLPGERRSTYRADMQQNKTTQVDKNTRL